jgi:integrase
VLQKRMTEALENRYFNKRNIGRTPFRDLGELYLERVVPLMKSVRSESIRVRWWMKYFGTRPLGQITRGELETFQRETRLRCRPATVNRELGRLRHMLNKAVEWDLLDENPMKGLKFLRENNARQRYLSLDECKRLLQACLALHVRAIVTVALHTGMRLGEILSLRHRDLDLASGFILIPDSKNGEPRHVPMDSVVLTLLQSFPRRPNAELIFSNSAGERFLEIRKAFGNARKRAGLGDLHFHDLRHTFASHWMMNGGDLYVLKEILGHKSITMTQRYSHLSPAHKREAVNRMDNMWRGLSNLSEVPNNPVSEALPVTGRSQTIIKAVDGAPQTLQ